LEKINFTGSFMKQLPAIKSTLECKYIAKSGMNLYGGRDVGGGYFRSYGLEYGNLLQMINEDQLFTECVNLVRNYTMLIHSKLANLYLLIAYWLPLLGHGDIIEFGSYRGGSAAFMALVATRLGYPINVYGLDTFKGMPSTNENLDLHSEGDFSYNSLEVANSLIEKLNLDNLKFIPGLFDETSKGVLNSCNPILLAHIDCDIESAVRYSYNTVKHYMINSGGYIVLDDPLHSSCLGAFHAMEDCMIRQDGLNAEQIYPHPVFRYPEIFRLQTY
jgi:hypothetical protein